MDEETVIMLANYISKLEDLNANYKLQIANLEEQVKNLKELLQIERKQVDILKAEIEDLKKRLEAAQKLRTALTVVAAIGIGTTILLFLK